MFFHCSARALSIVGFGDLSKSAAYITQTSRFTKLVVHILFQDDQIRVGLDLDEILGQIRICPDPLAITSICSGLRHRHFAFAFSLLFTSIEILRRVRRTTALSAGECECSHILSPVSPTVSICSRSGITAYRQHVGTIPHAMP
jgi:hypothetical protein